MKVRVSPAVSLNRANRSFSQVAHLVEKQGRAVICKNKRPKYLLVAIDNTTMLDMTDEEKIDVVAARVLKRYKPAFLELAK